MYKASVNLGAIYRSETISAQMGVAYRGVLFDREISTFSTLTPIIWEGNRYCRKNKIFDILLV